MTYQVKEIECVEEMPNYIWKKLSQYKSIFLEKTWIEYSSKEMNLSNRVIGIFDGNRLVGILPIFIVKEKNIDVWHNVYNFFKYSIDFNYSREYFENNKEEVLPYAIITSPFGYICDIISEIEFDYDTISKIQNQIDIICCREHAVICAYLWVKESSDCFEEVLLDKGFNKIFMGGDHYIDIGNFNSFDDFLNSMNKKKRSCIRREMRIFDKNQYTIYISKDIEGTIGEILDLRLNHLKKYENDVCLDKIKRELEFYLKYKENILIIKAYCENILVGYMIGFCKMSVFYCKSIGFDYEKSKKGYCYFNLLYKLIDYLIINTEVTKIEIGGGSVEAKLLKGFRIDNYFGYFKVYNEKMDWYINDICDYSFRKHQYYNGLVNLHLDI